MSDFEITALVLAEHDVFRREFTALEDLPERELAAAWGVLHARLEVHAVAEEELFYPLLAQEADEEEETAEGVHDHNEIRHAAAAVEDHEVGSTAWWEAVRAVRQVNADHMAEEEGDFVPSFKAAVPDEQREALGMRWLAFHDEHEQADGLSGADAEVSVVVATEVPEGDPTVEES